jgi:hypothetical protein
MSPSISVRWSFDHRLIPGPPLPVWSGSVGATARNCRAARLVITTQMYREASKPQALPPKEMDYREVDAAGCIPVAVRRW